MDHSIGIWVLPSTSFFFNYLYLVWNRLLGASQVSQEVLYEPINLWGNWPVDERQEIVSLGPLFKLQLWLITQDYKPRKLTNLQHHTFLVATCLSVCNAKWVQRDLFLFASKINSKRIKLRSISKIYDQISKWSMPI